MTISQLLYQSSQRLQDAGYFHAQREVEIFLADILAKDSAWILSHPEEQVDEGSIRQLDQAVNQRLEGRPVSYILGHHNFLGWNFLVDQRALIPRPETEQLVEILVKFIRPNNLERGQFLEIGTGSGVIAISLKKYFSDSHITATDISNEALELAEDNAKQLDTEINFLESNLFNNVGEKKFDLIVANLPYVPTSRLQFTSNQILDFEPMIAIDAGEDGLKYIQPLLEQAKNYLKPDGILALEMWHAHGEPIRDLVKKDLQDFEVEIIKDLAGYDRFALITNF